MKDFKGMLGKVDAGKVLGFVGLGLTVISGLISDKKEDIARKTLKSELRSELLEELTKKNG